jgi:hypothetical protein
MSDQPAIFDPLLFKRVFISNLEMLTSAMQKDSESRAALTGNLIMTEEETRQFARQFFVESLAKHLYNKITHTPIYTAPKNCEVIVAFGSELVQGLNEGCSAEEFRNIHLDNGLIKKYTFKSEEEKVAYIQGLEDSNGWEEYASVEPAFLKKAGIDNIPCHTLS